MLKVKLLDPEAIVPTIGHPGEDLGYDLYSLQTALIPPRGHVSLRTGVAVEFILESEPGLKFGLLAKERSSMASKGIIVMGGVIDAGYRGEIYLILGSFNNDEIQINKGDKVANLIPIPVAAKKVDVAELSVSQRGEGAFGSTDNEKRTT